MKERYKIAGYLVAAVILAHMILVVGCGRNPLTGAILGGNLTVGIGKL